MTPKWSKIVAIAAGLIILMGTLSRLQEQWLAFSQLSGLEVYGKYFFILAKALGVALLVETVADICRDTGEETIAARLLFFGKVEILLLSVPLMRELLALMQEVMA